MADAAQDFFDGWLRARHAERPDQAATLDHVIDVDLGEAGRFRVDAREGGYALSRDGRPLDALAEQAPARRADGRFAASPGDSLDARARRVAGLDRPRSTASRAVPNEGRALARVFPDTPSLDASFRR